MKFLENSSAEQLKREYRHHPGMYALLQRADDMQVKSPSASVNKRRTYTNLTHTTWGATRQQICIF